MIDKGEGPLAKMFDQIKVSVDTLTIALEVLAVLVAGTWALRMMTAFGKVGAAWGAMLLRMGPVGAAVLAGGALATAGGYGPLAEHFRERGRAEGAKDPDVAQTVGTAKAAQRAWGWIKDKLGFGSPGEPTQGPSNLPGLSEKAAADYAHRLGHRESGNNYAQPGNWAGFRGRWQMGGPALADAGYVVKGTTNRGLTNPANWTGKGGLGSLEDFLANKGGGQDAAFAQYTAINFARLKKLGVITDGMSEQEIAGWLAAAHLKGPEGAKKLAQGQDNVDGNGTSASSYFKMMKGLRSGQNLRLSPEGGSPFLGSMNAGDLEKIAANANKFSGGAAAGGAGNGVAPLVAPSLGTSITIHQNNETTVTGSGDPHDTAQEIGKVQSGLNGMMIRDVKGAVR